MHLVVKQAPGPLRLLQLLTTNICSIRAAVSGCSCCNPQGHLVLEHTFHGEVADKCMQLDSGGVTSKVNMASQKDLTQADTHLVLTSSLKCVQLHNAG